MVNMESVRWELKDRTDAYARLAAEVKMDAELAKPKAQSKRSLFVIAPVLASIAGVVLWLLAH